MEAGVIMQALDTFSAVSGQRIDPAKSSVWFSAITTSQEVTAVSAVLQLQQNDTASNYLGAPVDTNTSSYEFLLQRVSAKLHSWKSKMLSQAGRIVLIKSVLQALPLYHMGTVTLPPQATKQITDMIRRFFWGKPEEGRYMAYVAWERITAPKGMGGLGIKDLTTMNEAMIMKFLWRLANGSKAQWAQIVRAKYISRSDLWLSKRTYRCFVFWRCIMKLRTKLEPMVTWNIGDGSTCSALAQPWFQGALQVRPSDESQGKLVIADLVEENTGVWDAQKLINLFGYNRCMHILTNIKPPAQGSRQDTLTFELSKNEMYYVRKAYERLRRPS